MYSSVSFGKYIQSYNYHYEIQGCLKQASEVGKLLGSGTKMCSLVWTKKELLFSLREGGAVGGNVDKWSLDGVGVTALSWMCGRIEKINRNETGSAVEYESFK